MARHVGSDEAFDILLQHWPEDPDEQREALAPIFQAGLLVAAEIMHRREERERLWKDRGK